MKVTTKEVQQIIKEEAIRLKKRMMLEAEKASIIKQINEMDEPMEEPIDEAFGFSAKEKFEKAKTAFISTWTSKGAPNPSPQEMQAIDAAAAADKYQGKMGLNGVKNNVATYKFIYRPSGSLKWDNPMAGGGTGGSPSGGSAGA